MRQRRAAIWLQYGMARTQTLVQMTDELLARLDAERAERKCSRSALIRLAVEELLDRRSTEAKVRQWVAGYRQVPADGADEWGDLDKQSEQNRRHNAAELDADEQSAGLSW